jgi:hypothetical protein
MYRGEQMKTPRGNVKWTIEELRVLRDNAGKMPISEITKLVNAVHGNNRKEENIKHKGNLQGFSFEIKD